MQEISRDNVPGMQNRKVEKIVDPTLATFVKLDDLMVKLDELLHINIKNQELTNTMISTDRYIHTILSNISQNIGKISDANGKNQGPINTKTNADKLTNTILYSISQNLREILDTDNRNQKFLSHILKELKDEADEGEYIQQNGTVTSTQFVILNTETSPSHPVKGFILKNDGPNDILFAHNASMEGIDASIEDTLSTSTTLRFEKISQDEEVRFMFNRRVVKNVHLISQGGNSSFRSWLVW